MGSQVRKKKTQIVALAAASAIVLLACPQTDQAPDTKTPATPGPAGGDEPTTPTPQETMKSWPISVAHFGDEADVWAQTTNRSAPYAWDRIAAGKVRVSIDGQDLPLENVSYRPVFADDLSGAEWKVDAEVREGEVVLVLTAPDQSDEGGFVERITVTSRGSGYTSAPTVSFSAPPSGGVRATATAAASMGVGSVTVTYDGAQTYASRVPPTVSFSAPPSAGAMPTATAALKGEVYDVDITNHGSGYTSAPTVAFGGPGTGAVATAFLQTGVASVTMTNNGSGYNSSPTVTFGNPASGTNVATGTAVLSLTGTVTDVTITNRGSGYTSAPTVSFSGGSPSTAATATATLQSGIASVAVVGNGSGYATVPTVTFTGGGGSGAAGTAVLSGAVDTVTVTDPGYGYTSAPTVIFSQVFGQAASATSALRGVLGEVTITNRGSGYPMRPTITITGGSGTGATAIAEWTEPGNDQFQNLYWARRTLEGRTLQVRIADEE